MKNVAVVVVVVVVIDVVAITGTVSRRVTHNAD